MKSLRKYIANTIISLSVTVLTILLLAFGVLEKFELSSYDLRFRVRGPEKALDNIVIVAIDDQTLEELQAIWPLPRSYYAKAIENLKYAGAKVIAFDIEFFTERDLADDAIFAEALRKYKDSVIIAKKMMPKVQKYEFSSLMPIPMFTNSGCSLGNIDMVNDSDGFVRRALLVEDNDDPNNQFFATKIISQYKNAGRARISEDKRSVLLGKYSIPITEDGAVLVNFAGPTMVGPYPIFPRYSLSQILDSETDYGIKLLAQKGILKDKIVLVGATFTEARDVEKTPFFLYSEENRLFSKVKTPLPGVEVHANIINTILQENYIKLLSDFQTYAFILLLSLLVGVIMIKLRPIGGIFATLVLIVLYFAISVYAFVGWRLWISMIGTMVSIFFTYVAVVVYNFLVERKQRKVVRGAFAHYVPEKVVSELLKNPEMLKLGGQERVLSVLFSDVAGFTTLSETMKPAQLQAFLTEYLTPMTEIVLKHDGIIDKYEGDAVMAEFGIPLPLEDHALKACYVALEMQAKLKEMREEWIKVGKPPIKARVGIATGNMAFGNMGSRDVFDYTVIGDTVNLASRLEGANKEYGTYIMISETTYAEVKDKLITRQLDALRVKGKIEPVKVFEVIAKTDDGLPPEQIKVVEEYNLGLEAYKNQRWDEAINCFETALEINPDDGPSKTYIERCKDFKENPPGEDWDGVYVMKTK